MSELSVNAIEKKGDSALNNLKRAALGIPKAGVGLGETIGSVFTLDASGTYKGLSKVVEGLSDVPAGLVGAAADGVTLYFLTPTGMTTPKSPLKQALEEQK